MFENLDQNKGQNLPGNAPAPLMGNPSSFSSGNNGGSAPAPLAPKVEDMFAGVKDIAAPALKNPGMPSMPKMPLGEKKSAGNGGRIFFVTLIILIIIGLGVFLAGKFLGADVLNPSSWASKISGFSSLFVKQPVTNVVNNFAPATSINQQPTIATTTQANLTASTTLAATTTAPIATSTANISGLTATSTLDSDLDGLTDYEEINIYHTNPNLADSDKDGLTDSQEVKIYHTDPNNPDTDGDGYPDGTEVQNNYNPLGPGKMPASAAVSQSGTTKCDSIDCLIAMASTCQKAEFIYNFSSPFPLIKELTFSGNSYYGISGKNADGSCSLVQQSRGGSVTLSEKNRQALIAGGQTEAQINDQIATINASLNSPDVLKSIFTCTGTSVNIASFLKNAKNGSVEQSCQGGVNETQCTVSPNLTCVTTKTS